MDDIPELDPNTKHLLNTDLHLIPDTNPKSSGHEVDFGAFTWTQNRFRPWIFKHNKHEGLNGRDASVLEVAFSEVASLFIRPGLTPPAKIVRDADNQVIGVASEGFQVHIQQVREHEPCYSYHPTNSSYNPLLKDIPLDQANLRGVEASVLLTAQTDKLEAAKAGVHFLDEMRPDFFHTLMQKHRDGVLHIDMDSLASILTASYVLEEDDLHKGNIGFYVTDMRDENGEILKNAKRENQKKFTFFKIDHDLMFMDSVMSTRDMRLANILYDENSFKMTARDLDGFPDLQDSGNHYWPTKSRLMVKGTKAYGNAGERQAFADLKDDAAFKQAKWRDFLKYAVLPMDLIAKSLTRHLDEETDIDKINMIKHSVSARQMQLKQTLLASNGFIPFLNSNGPTAMDEIKAEILNYMTNADIDPNEKEEILSKIDKTFETFQDVAASRNSASVKNSALTETIMLDCYSFAAANKPSNDDISWAKSRLDDYSRNQDHKNAFKYACILVDLINRHEKSHEEDISFHENFKIKASDYKKEYLKPEEITTIEQFIAAANKIRACDLPLKQQKNELLAVLQNAKLTPNELKKLKAELSKNEADNPSLKFIHQLRNDLWLVRKIYGTYGTTATSSMMIKEIDRQTSIEETQRYRKQLADTRDPVANNEQPEPDYNDIHPD